MNSELQQLRDIHLPNAISMWWIAPGWIILYIFLLMMIIYVIYFFYKRYKKKYTIRFALAKLDQLQHLLDDNPEQINIAAEISILLRRTALHYYRRESIAGLTGEAWLDFLNRSGNTVNFTQKVDYLVVAAPYQKECTSDLLPLFEVVRAWLMTIANGKVSVVEK